MSNLYDEPGSTSVNLFLANNTKADLQANLDNRKIGLETDTNHLGFRDDNGNYNTLMNVGDSVSTLASVSNSIVLGRGTSGSGAIEQLSLSSDYGLTYTYAANSLKINTSQDLRSSASPTFATLTATTGIIANAVSRFDMSIWHGGNLAVKNIAGDSFISWASRDTTGTEAKITLSNLKSVSLLNDLIFTDGLLSTTIDNGSIEAHGGFYIKSLGTGAIGIDGNSTIPIVFSNGGSTIAYFVSAGRLCLPEVYAGAGESRFWLSTFVDPHVGSGYAIKVGDGGIAVNGNSIFNHNVQLGNTTSASTATPVNLSLGGTYADNATQAAKCKLKLYEDGTYVIGLGVSGNQLNYHASTGDSHCWYLGGSQNMVLTEAGLNIGSDPNRIVSGWGLNIWGDATSVNDIVGIKLLSGYTGEYSKWCGIASVTNDTNANSTSLALYADEAQRLIVGASLTNILNNVLLGNTTSSSTATPISLSLGGTFSSTAGANPKLSIYDDGTYKYGFGVSNLQMDYMVPSSQSHAFYIDGVLNAKLSDTTLSLRNALTFTTRQLVSTTPASPISVIPTCSRIEVPGKGSGMDFEITLEQGDLPIGTIISVVHINNAYKVTVNSAGNQVHLKGTGAMFQKVESGYWRPLIPSVP